MSEDKTKSKEFTGKFWDNGMGSVVVIMKYQEGEDSETKRQRTFMVGVPSKDEEATSKRLSANLGEFFREILGADQDPVQLPAPTESGDDPGSAHAGGAGDELDPGHGDDQPSHGQTKRQLPGFVTMPYRKDSGHG